MSPNWVLISIGCALAITAALLGKKGRLWAAVGGILIIIIGLVAIRGGRVEPACAAWQPTQDMMEKMIVHPTGNAAARVVGTRLGKELRARLPAQRGPYKLLVLGDAPRSLRAIIATRIAEEYPSMNAYSATPGTMPTTMPASTAQTIVVTVNEMDSMEHIPHVRKCMQATAEIPNEPELRRHVGFITRFSDKPWADEPSMIGNGQARYALEPSAMQAPTSRYVAAWSYQPCASHSQAMSQARQNAARIVFPIVLDRLFADPGPRRSAWRNETLLKNLEALLGQSGAITGEFSQESDRSYGRIWRGAVLVDTGGKEFNAMVDKLRIRMASEGQRSQMGFISVIVMAAVIMLVYLLMDVLTKGYFTKPLRAAAIGLLIIGVIAVVALA